MTQHSETITDWNLDKLENVYFLGIGGIGMSALARYFNNLGIRVSGYDRTPTPLTNALISEGIAIHFEDDVQCIPASFSAANRQNAMVVYTPAIPASSSELIWLRSQDYRIEKRAKVLGEIANSTTCLAVAGTHGKTTTTAIVAHILHDSGRGCNAFIGGITANYNSNVILSKTSPLTVVEADEFDRSFLALTPKFAVITSVDADHLDIYSGREDLEDSFQKFALGIKPGGTLIKQKDIPTRSDCNTKSYSVSGSADITAENIRIEDGRYYFDLGIEGVMYPDFSLGLPGRHNIENALAAIGICMQVDVDIVSIQSAISSFRGVRRRFDVHINREDQVYVDDYAHHPREIDACLSSVKEMFPEKKVTVIFQPHLFTRTRDFIEEFAVSLSAADRIILLPIYPAREVPIDGVDSQWLLDKITNPAKKSIQKSDLLNTLSQDVDSVVITMGAGDIDQLVDPIIQLLS